MERLNTLQRPAVLKELQSHKNIMGKHRKKLLINSMALPI